MKTAKDITTLLASFERDEKFSDAPQEIPGWREATRLKLLKAVNISKRTLSEGNPKNRE
jgi:hypothetical protein